MHHRHDARGWQRGDELPAGEIGHVCFAAADIFGYVNDPAATTKAISRDGFL